jgi:hypothetical protein
MKQLMKKLMLLVWLLLLGFGMSVEGKESRKVESWIHLCAPMPTYLTEAKEFALRAKNAGYTGIILLDAVNSPKGDRAMSKLVDYIVDDLKLEVIPEIKLMGKSIRKTFGRKFVKEHQKLFVGEVLDPYAQYKGKPAFESLMIPLLNDKIKLFRNPKYFHLGYDEYKTDDMKKIAERHGKTLCDVWAGTLNRAVDYLLARNITPIIWGDMLLSQRLAEANNPVGYPPDKRFKTASGMHSIFPPNSKLRTDVLGCVKKIRNRGKIIVGDWHYGTGNAEGKYPSVDYLQWLGFKEVVPTTWGNPVNMQRFSQYARKRGCRIMIASIWHYFRHSQVRHLLWPTVDNNIIFFNNPDREIPLHPAVMVLRNNKLTLWAKPGETIKLKMGPAASRDVEFEAYPATGKGRDKRPIVIKGRGNSASWQIPKDARQGLWTIQGYARQSDGYLLHGMKEAGFYIGSKQPFTGKRKPGTFMSVDFADCVKFGPGGRNVLLNGYSDTMFGMLKGNAEISNGALNCRSGGLIIGRSFLDVKTLKPVFDKGISISIEFSMNTTSKGVGALWAWGRYGSLRMFVINGRLQMQFGRKGAVRVAILSSKRKLLPNKKYHAMFKVENHQAILLLNGVEQSRKKVSTIGVSGQNPLCLGYSSVKKYYFQGKIYRFKIKGIK